MVNSKAKGGAAERLIAKILADWWGEPFARRPNKQKGSDHIVPKSFPFAVEVKDDKKLKVRHFFNPTNVIREFWEQARSQAEREHKQPLLICKAEGTWFAVSDLQMSRIDGLELRLDDQFVYVRTLLDFQRHKEVIQRTYKCK